MLKKLAVLNEWRLPQVASLVTRVRPAYTVIVAVAIAVQAWLMSVGTFDLLYQSTIAEGVERAEDAEWLNQAQCELAQGYLFSEPVPREHLSELLRAAQRASRSAAAAQSDAA